MCTYFRFWWQFTLAIQCLYSISSTPGYRLFFFSSSYRISFLVDRPLPPPAVRTQGRPEFGRNRFHCCFASFFQPICSPSPAPSGFLFVTGHLSIQRHRAGLKHKHEKDFTSIPRLMGFMFLFVFCYLYSRSTVALKNHLQFASEEKVGLREHMIHITQKQPNIWPLVLLKKNYRKQIIVNIFLLPWKPV